jgi:hypothetical protein
MMMDIDLAYLSQFDSELVKKKKKKKEDEIRQSDSE